MAETDLQIRGVGEGGAVSKKMFFRPFGPQFGLKIRGAGPFPGSATVIRKKNYTDMTQHSKTMASTRGVCTYLWNSAVHC